MAKPASIFHPKKADDFELTTYRYTLRGEVAEVNGATYPLRYEYDAAGRLWKLHTYQAEPGANLNETGSVTTWLYVPGTSLLWKKLDAAGAGAVYGYDAQGRLQTRTWARSVGGLALTTTYTYNLAGDMKHLDYSDSTPDVTLAYDARGRLASRTDGAGTTALSYYGETGQVADEIGSDGSRLHREVDGAGRETGYYLWDRFRFATWGGWGYAAATGKVDGAMTEAGWVSYAETANLTKRETVLMGTGVKTVAQRNGLGRLQSLATLVGTATPTPLAGRRYEYTAEGRVGKVSEGSTTNNGAAWTDTGRWEYSYDDEGRGQVKQGRKYAGAQPLAGMKRGYRYDAIGNRVESKVNTLDNDWAPNGLNQIVSRSVEGKQYLVGEANPLAMLTVQAEGDQLYSSTGPSPKVDITRGPGNWFSAEIDTANDALAKNLKVTVTEQVDTATAREAIGHVFVPGSREQFSHDADGNLTRDGHWTYTWDAENRLVAVETRHDITVHGPDPLPVLRLEFSYDALSRRVGKKVYESVGGNSWVLLRTIKFTYEGWNLIAESEPLSGSPTTYGLLRTYQWGTDLSGSRQGAGGVGGLLVINKHSANGTVQSYYPCYGDNGNIEALLDVSDPQAGVTVAASYEYGPFGEALRATGAMANANPFRFSTRYTDQETGLVMYPLRPYSPSIGRWLSRDRLEEDGGLNLMAFVDNDPTNYIDPIGLAKCTCEYVDDFTVTFNASLLGSGFGGGGQADLYVRPRLNYASVEQGNDSVEANLSWSEKAYFDENSASGKALKDRYKGITNGGDYDVSGSPAWKQNTSTRAWWNRMFVRTKHQSYQAGDPTNAIHDNARTFAGTTQAIHWTVKVASSPACARLADKKYAKGYLLEASFTIQSELKKSKSGHQKENAYMWWSYTVWEMDGDTKGRIIKEDSSK